MDMYIKLTKSKKYTYVQLVEGYREKNKVKHKILINLGRLDLLQKNKSLEDIVSKLSEITNSKSLLDIRKCKSEKIYNFGYLAYKKIWRSFNLDILLSNIQHENNTSFDLNNTCLLMAINHLLNPHSKLGVYNNQELYMQYQAVELNHLYRSLDMLNENKEKIETKMFEINRNLYGMKIDVVFYDVTTFHFESVSKDGLKNFGYSKANKINEVQVMLGMLVDYEGRPISYELFPGNTSESKTLITALDKLEKRFGIRNVIIVADRGINSGLNLKTITDKGYNYIISSRIKKLNKDTKEQIFNEDGYENLSEDFKYKVIDYINKIQKTKIKLKEKMIITYSQKRAEKDKKDRARLIDKAERLLADKSLIRASSKRGGKKYLKETVSTDWVLDQTAIQKDEKYDGYYAIQTNVFDLSVEKILDSYHALWKIEESFRIMKSTLEVRPIFHWTEPRIKGHFVVCFLAFLLERTMEIELRKAGIVASPQNIRDELNAMRINEINYNNNTYYLRSEISKIGTKILGALKIKIPQSSGVASKYDIEKLIR